MSSGTPADFATTDDAIADQWGKAALHIRPGLSLKRHMTFPADNAVLVNTVTPRPVGHWPMVDGAHQMGSRLYTDGWPPGFKIPKGMQFVIVGVYLRER